MLAYKKLTFEYYVEIRNGNFLGELVAVNKKAGTKDYELKLNTNALSKEDIKTLYNAMRSNWDLNNEVDDLPELSQHVPQQTDPTETNNPSLGNHPQPPALNMPPPSP